MAGSETPQNPPRFSVDLQACAACGKTFIPRANGKPQLYCSVKCKRHAEYLRSKGEEPHPKARTPKRRRKSKRPTPPKTDLPREDFEDMMDPIGDYESMLRLSVRRLKQALEDPDTKDRELAGISKQLLSASRELEQFSDSDSLIDDDVEETTDDEFEPEAV